NPCIRRTSARVSATTRSSSITSTVGLITPVLLDPALLATHVIQPSSSCTKKSHDADYFCWMRQTLVQIPFHSCKDVISPMKSIACDYTKQPLPKRWHLD